MVKLKNSLWLWVAVVVGGIGIIMGLLFPAGRDPFVPQSSALAVKGRAIWEMIMENQRKCKEGGKWCDPLSCSNSVDFLEKIFHSFDDNGLYTANGDIRLGHWNIAIDMPQDCDTLFPVLISANFDPAFLGGHFADGEILPVGRGLNAQEIPLKSKGIVVVRKSGVSHVIKANRCTRKVIFETSIASNRHVTYLTPRGKVTINICCCDK